MVLLVILLFSLQTEQNDLPLFLSTFLQALGIEGALLAVLLLREALLLPTLFLCPQLLNLRMSNCLGPSYLVLLGLFQWLDSLVHLHVCILALHLDCWIIFIFLSSISPIHAPRILSPINSRSPLVPKKSLDTFFFVFRHHSSFKKKKDWSDCLFEWLPQDTFSLKNTTPFRNTLVHVFLSDTVNNPVILTSFFSFRSEDGLSDVGMNFSNSYCSAETKIQIVDCRAVCSPLHLWGTLSRQVQ